MQSLAALIRNSRADDPLAGALEAILDSGLIVFSRDTQGRFVQLSNILSDRVGIIAEPGSSQPRNMRVFDEQGRLLPGSHYPAAITRMTGNAQRNVLRRLVSDDDREIWLNMSTLPLERGPEGWSVLTVASDVTDQRQQIAAQQQEIAARGLLLALADRLATETLDQSALIDAFQAPLKALMPEASISLGQSRGGEFWTTPITTRSTGSPAAARGRFTAELNSRWTADHAHINLDVQDTDIYGAHVVAEFPNAIRSMVIAPCRRGDNLPPAALAAAAGEPAAFSDAQIATVELAARMFGRALPPTEPLASA